VSESADEQKAGSAEESTGLWEQVSTLFLAVLIALGIRAFVIEPYRIPSESMLPTLLIGDHLFVNKFVYGIKIPFTDVRLPGLREPERGEVVVFTVAKRGQETKPADRRPELPTEEYVKRIVGIPGDRVAVHRDVVRVNGEPMNVRNTGELFESPSGRELLIEDVNVDEREYQILDDPGKYGLSQGVMTVPEGRYFVLGDNRDHSKDSRDWGTVRLAEIKGPAWFIYFSWDFKGGWGEVLNPVTWWKTEKRWGRTFDRLD
jgi:signal peptidase I